jgi:uncharacterized protein YwgA
MDIPVELYAPYGTSQKELQLDFLAGVAVRRPERIQPGLIALVEILNSIEQEPYHWPIGRTTFQKIAFVATAEGLPTGLHYQKGSYGPFSPEIKGLITRLVNNGLIKEETLGRMFSVKVGPTYEDARQAYQDDLRRWDSIIGKVADLFMRLRTAQSEIVSTVLFAAKFLHKDQKDQPTELQVLTEVMNWKVRRRPPLEMGEVAYTIRNLAALRWLKVRPSADLPLPQEDFEDAHV